MNPRRRGLLAELVLLGATVGAVWLVSHPEDLRYVRPWLQQLAIRTCQQGAAALGRVAIRLEAAYRVEVSP